MSMSHLKTQTSNKFHGFNDLHTLHEREIGLE